MRSLFFILFAVLLIAGCVAKPINAPAGATASVTVTTTRGTPLPTLIPTPQGFSTPITYGPNPEDFPANINPLSGQQVKDPSLLKTPGVMVSISHFPVSARPQAGLSFAPWVFEFYITEGATRFLSVFYGGFPEPEIPLSGDCLVRREPFVQTSTLLGNRIWLDENQNGVQEDYEKGLGGLCVNLYDSKRQPLQQTTSDSNGYYGFNVEPGNYIVEFKLPAWLKFTQKNVGVEDKDSDADPVTGQAEAEVRSAHLYLDAGLIPSSEATQPVDTSLPAAEVGPVRSGRLLYIDIHNFFPNSCFIYASASPEILDMLPQCYFVLHDDTTGGAMLSLEKMRALAEDSRQAATEDFTYASNIFSEQPPNGGWTANLLKMYVALRNQAAFVYDPLSGSYWRYVDDTSQENAGILHPEIDRLTGRQLQFENVIVLYVEQEVFEFQGTPVPALIDTYLELGNGGYAYLFRDGMKYDIRWSTKAREYEKQTGQARPIYFVDADGNPVPLKPGRTWLFVATPYSYVTNQMDGSWVMRFTPPEGAR
ncbi:MAG TPA: SdrD B-like domain-containing protein [Anaerolineales bacterium]|nr:SdrD B-like domain-containing protein [Anaerolineales bacterium]HNO31062.1 SdrD B-like domain-containing protein [Anaerolineales bacterium]